MTEPTQTPAGGAPPMNAFDTANDRLKRSFGSWLWGSMMAAVVVPMECSFLDWRIDSLRHGL